MTTIGRDLAGGGISLPFQQQEQTQTQIKSQLSAMDFYLGIEFDKGHLARIVDIKAALREEILMLKDILTDWDGPTTITYRSPVRQPDGSLKLIETTKTFTYKDEVKNLINYLEQILSTI